MGYTPTRDARMPLEKPQHQWPYATTRLGRLASRGGYTLKSLSDAIGVSMPDMGNYLRGHRKRVGRDKKRHIRQGMVALGLVKIQPHQPPKCRSCGLQYPTRKVE